MSLLHILLAEDNPADVLWLKLTLDGMGIEYRLTLAEDGEQARDYLRDCGSDDGIRPDLVMLDINLPKLTGIEVLQAVPAAARLPVCFVSGSHVERKFVLNHFGPAVVSYISKPVDRDKILDCLRSYEQLRPIADKIQKCRAAKSGS